MGGEAGAGRGGWVLGGVWELAGGLPGDVDGDDDAGGSRRGPGTYRDWNETDVR